MKRVFGKSGENVYRHELKYVVTQAQIAVMRSRITSFMTLDLNAGKNRSYEIRSLYFDDYKNTCYYENENGVSPREKFRIRIYDGKSDHIRLELKRKDGGKTHKDSCNLTRQQCLSMIGKTALESSKEYPPVLQKFQLLQRTAYLQPKVIVEYDREAYVYRNGNVRVTFDTDIRSSNDGMHFLEPSVDTRPIMPTGFHVLEVKYDEHLPDFIYRAIQLPHLRLSTFSKFYLCRKYSLGVMNHVRI